MLVLVLFPTVHCSVYEILRKLDKEFTSRITFPKVDLVRFLAVAKLKLNFNIRVLFSITDKPTVKVVAK